MARLSLITCTLIVPGVLGNAWLTQPISRVELVTSHFQNGMPDNQLRYCPSCSCGSNACFAGGGENAWVKDISLWQKWYDAAGVSVPHLSPGHEVDFQFTVTADHGGQAWVLLSCNESFDEDNTWYMLNRGVSHGRLPSNPRILAWGPGMSGSFGSHASWVVPADFSCPNGRGVGRWLWKTANSCYDVHNNGRKTETFKLEEYMKIPGASSGLDTCGKGCGITCGDFCEEFGSCFDFTIGPKQPIPTPEQKCEDKPLAGAWSGYECSHFAFDAATKFYCRAHAVFKDACCFCGGGLNRSGSAAVVSSDEGPFRKITVNADGSLGGMDVTPRKGSRSSTVRQLGTDDNDFYHDYHYDYDDFSDYNYKATVAPVSAHSGKTTPAPKK